MKRIIYGISFLALVGIFIVGCQKEQQYELTPTSIEKKDEIKVKDSNSRFLTSYRVFYWIGNGQPGGLDPICEGSGGNCLPDFIVRGEVFNDFNDAITNATQADYFTSNQVADLFDMVDPVDINDFQSDLASGDLLFLREIAEDGTNYYILIKTENATLDLDELVGELVEIVIPIQFEEE